MLMPKPTAQITNRKPQCLEPGEITTIETALVLQDCPATFLHRHCSPFLSVHIISLPTEIMKVIQPDCEDTDKGLAVQQVRIGG